VSGICPIPTREQIPFFVSGVPFRKGPFRHSEARVIGCGFRLSRGQVFNLFHTNKLDSQSKVGFLRLFFFWFQPGVFC